MISWDLMYELEGRSPIWGAATAGLFIGIVVGFFVGDIGGGAVKGALIGALVGLVTEVFYRLTSRNKNA